MFKIGFIGTSYRTQQLIDQLLCLGYSNIGIYSSDDLKNICQVQKFNNPFQLISESQILIVSYIGADTFGIISECIFDSKSIILDQLHCFSTQSINQLFKLAQEAGVMVIPLYHTLYYSILNEMTLLDADNIVLVKVKINGKPNKFRSYAIDELSFQLLALANKLLKGMLNQYFVISHTYKNTNLQTIDISYTYFNQKFFGICYDEALLVKKFEIDIITHSNRMHFDILNDRIVHYEIHENGISLNSEKTINYIQELPYILNNQLIDSKQINDHAFLLLELKENLKNWHLVSNQLTSAVTFQ